MPTEDDMILLESYLDDALSPTEVAALDARLNEDAELTAALEQLRAERAARRQAFSSMEPSQAAADRFAGHVLAAVRRKESGFRWSGFARWGGLAAACVLIGFGAGWMTRLSVASGPSGQPVIQVINTPTETGGVIQAALLDQEGNLLGMHKFQSVEDAKQFVDELKIYRAGQSKVLQGQPAEQSQSF